MIRRPALALPALALVVLASACSGGGGESPTAAPPTAPLAPQPAVVEFDSYDHINHARSDHSVEPLLDLREAVSRVARLHSENMRDAGFFDHHDPQGRDLGARLHEAGVSFRAAAENLALVRTAGNPAAMAHEMLMASPTHRPNILDSRFELVGVGVAREGDRYWFTQVFIER